MVLYTFRSGRVSVRRQPGRGCLGDRGREMNCLLCGQVAVCGACAKAIGDLAPRPNPAVVEVLRAGVSPDDAAALVEVMGRAFNDSQLHITFPWAEQSDEVKEGVCRTMRTVLAAMAKWAESREGE